MKTVTVYTRNQCGLCRAALGVLERVRASHPFDLQQRDVEHDLAPGDPRKAPYAVSIPVVEIDGEVAFRHEVDAEALARLVGEPSRPR